MYTITPRGKRAVKIIEEIRSYGLELMEEFGVGLETGSPKEKKKKKKGLKGN